MFSGNGKQLHAGLTIAIVASIWLSIAAGNAVSEAGMLANVPSTITVEMWELQPNGNRGGQRCINYGGARSSNWGCTAYCSQVSPYPCTNPVTDPPPVPKPSGQNAWVYPFTSNQVTVEIDGSATYDGSTYNRYLHDVVPQETHPEAFAAKAVTAQAIAARTYAYHRGSAGTIDNSAGYQVSPAIVPPGSTHTLDVFVQNTGVDAWDTTYALSYWLCRSPSDCDNVDGARRVQLTSPLLPGQTRWLSGLPVYFPASWRGPATISLDMRTSSAWFGTGGWYSQDIPVCIGSCTKVYLPIQRRGYIPQNH